ncbi:MAG: hypothetical protein ISS77_00980 [Phycisphaerae bacterium]|nr:hypothetical protein [Phycisphaerae bacterium]
MTLSVEQLQANLDSFDILTRKQALEELIENGRLSPQPVGTDTNLHFHTFFSFNCCGYSPTKIAWLSKMANLAVAGIVDFDVLDAVEEFFSAAKKLNIKATAGIETRVFVPEFHDKVINSPGEPGIAYHMGTGFPTASIPEDLSGFADKLRQTTADRNRGLVKRVNAFLDPVILDYEKDVLPLTPAGNATERHITVAYAQKAQQIFTNNDQLAQFWSTKLSAEINIEDLPQTVKLTNLIRSKTMKRGGVGYVQPDGKAFPLMAEMNNFVLAAGGIPTLAWLNGTTEGEQQIEELLKIAISSGVAAVNIIPDRNYDPDCEGEDIKCEKLYAFVELAQKLDLPVIAGTEMNSPGQKFVDDFNSKQLAPLAPVFLKGAYIVYAHSILQRNASIGYTGKWADENFETTKQKNEFFEMIGKSIDPDSENILNNINENSKPQDILNLINA